MIKKEIIENHMIDSMILYIRCTNKDTLDFCKYMGWDILTFIDHIKYD